MAARGATETAAPYIRALRLRLLRNFRRRHGNVRDALMRRVAPLAAVKVFLVPWFEMIVGNWKKGAERRVVVANTRNEIVVGVRAARTDRRRPVVRPATGQHSGGQTADEHQTDASAPFHFCLG